MNKQKRPKTRRLNSSRSAKDYELYERAAGVVRQRQLEEAKRLDEIQKRLDARRRQRVAVNLSTTNIKLRGPGVYIRPVLVMDRASSKTRNVILGAMQSTGWTVNKKGDRLTIYDLKIRGYPEQGVIKMLMDEPDTLPNGVNKAGLLFNEPQLAQELLSLI